MNQEKIGKFIAECIKNKNITQEELAEKLGVSRKSVSRWENGNTMPDYAIIDSLCAKLGISINELYYGKKINDEDYKNISEQNLRLYIMTKYKKQIVIKRSIISAILTAIFYILFSIIFINYL